MNQPDIGPYLAWYEVLFLGYFDQFLNWRCRGTPGEELMRVADDRYRCDRVRLDVALRLIGHEARMCLVGDARRRGRKQALIAPFANLRRGHFALAGRLDSGVPSFPVKLGSIIARLSLDSRTFVSAPPRLA